MLRTGVRASCGGEKVHLAPVRKAAHRACGPSQDVVRASVCDPPEQRGSIHFQLHGSFGDSIVHPHHVQPASSRAKIFTLPPSALVFTPPFGLAPRQSKRLPSEPSSLADSESKPPSVPPNRPDLPQARLTKPGFFHARVQDQLHFAGLKTGTRSRPTQVNPARR